MVFFNFSHKTHNYYILIHKTMEIKSKFRFLIVILKFANDKLCVAVSKLCDAVDILKNYCSCPIRKYCSCQIRKYCSCKIRKYCSCKIRKYCRCQFICCICQIVCCSNQIMCCSYPVESCMISLT